MMLLISIIVAIPLGLFYLAYSEQKKQEELKALDKRKHDASEKVLGPERKRHEAEKKRWENEY